MYESLPPALTTRRIRQMKNYFMGAVLAGVMFIAAPTTTQAAGLTQTQIQAVISLLQAFGAEPAVIESAGKAMGLTITNSTVPAEVEPKVVEPKFSVKSVTAKTEASTTTASTKTTTRYGVIAALTPAAQTDTYGSYTLALEVTAGDKTVLIPMTTTDSTQGLTGVVYSLEGQEFRGSQSSSWACPTSGKNCKISAGQTRLVKVTVQLNPNEVGNYGVSFDKLNYLLGKHTETKSWRINGDSEVIYIK